MSQKSTSQRRVATGWLLIIGVVALAILILILSDITEGRRDTVDLVTTFSEADRLQPGTPVWIAGHEVGEVTDVGFLPPGRSDDERIVAIVRIPAEDTALLRLDSRSRLTTRQPLGPPVIELLPGSAEAPPAQPGDTLRELESTGLEQAVERAQTTTEHLDTLSTALGSLARLIEGRRETVQALQDPARGARLEIDTASRHLRTGPLGDALAEEGLAVRVRYLRATLADLRMVVDSIVSATGGTDDEPAESIASIRDRLESVQGELNRLSRSLESAEGAAGRFARDPAIRNAVESVRMQADSLASELRRNPFRIF